MTIKKFHLGMAAALLVAGGAAYWLQRGALLSGGGASPQAVGRDGARDVAAGKAGPAAPAAVEVARVERLSLQDAVQAVGALRARQSVMLRPEASGRITRLGFADGQRVRRGQLLVQLDDSVQRAQLLQAQAQAHIASTTVQRNRDLAAQGFVSPSVVDQSAASLEVAQSQIALAQAQLQRMRINAPFDGVAGIRQVNVGDYVKDGADLVNVEDLGAMLVDFRLPESALSRLKAGQVVEVMLDALPGRTLAAKVDSFDAQLDANGRSLLVRARLAPAEGMLRSGMFARVRIVFAQRDAALVVPEEALVPMGGKQYVIKVLRSDKGAASQRLEAVVGLRVPGKVEILRGLAVGDTVVTAGQTRLMREDQAVRVVELGVAPGGASGASGAASGVASGAASGATETGASGVRRSAASASTR